MAGVEIVKVIITTKRKAPKVTATIENSGTFGQSSTIAKAIAELKIGRDKFFAGKTVEAFSASGEKLEIT